MHVTASVVPEEDFVSVAGGKNSYRVAEKGCFLPPRWLLLMRARQSRTVAKKNLSFAFRENSRQAQLELALEVETLFSFISLRLTRRERWSRSKSQCPCIVG